MTGVLWLGRGHIIYIVKQYTSQISDPGTSLAKREASSAHGTAMNILGERALIKIGCINS